MASSHHQAFTLLWLRHDLRLHDQRTLHEAATYASSRGESLLICWFFESRWTEMDRFGTQRIGSKRATFLLETAESLQRDLRQLGNDLVVLDGDPINEITQVVKRGEVSALFASAHVAIEEVRQEEALKKALSQQGVPCHFIWNHTLTSPHQLPFALSDLPDVFSHFRKRFERGIVVADPLPAPHELPPVPTKSDLPLCTLKRLLETWRSDIDAQDERAAIVPQAGEQHGLARLQYYFWEERHIERYKETRNGLIGSSYSTKFSPWLAAGSISPRTIWAETLRYEKERVANSSTYWIRFELLWREYFQWVALLSGPSLFQWQGLTLERSRPVPRRGRHHQRSFHRWVHGETGDAFVDANMRELSCTGWMSNRGRQNVASYLIHDLGLDWRMGAGYFEQALLDYDPASNWGNWAYIAGVGNDPRPIRRFNTRGQAKRYDPDGAFQRLWDA